MLYCVCEQFAEQFTANLISKRNKEAACTAILAFQDQWTPLYENGLSLYVCSITRIFSSKIATFKLIFEPSKPRKCLFIKESTSENFSRVDYIRIKFVYSDIDNYCREKPKRFMSDRFLQIS